MDTHICRENTITHVKIITTEFQTFQISLESEQGLREQRALFVSEMVSLFFIQGVGT